MTRIRLVVAIAVCGLMLHMFSGVLGLTTDSSTRTLRNADPGPVPGGPIDTVGDADGVLLEPSGVDGGAPAMVDLSDPGAAAPGFQPAPGTPVDGAEAPLTQVESVPVPAGAVAPADVAGSASAAPAPGPASVATATDPAAPPAPPAPAAPVAPVVTVAGPVASPPSTVTPTTGTPSTATPSNPPSNLPASLPSVPPASATVSAASVGSSPRSTTTAPATPASPVSTTTTLAATGRPPVPSSAPVTTSTPSTPATVATVPTVPTVAPSTSVLRPPVPTPTPTTGATVATVATTATPPTTATAPTVSAPTVTVPTPTPTPTNGGPSIDVRSLPAATAGSGGATIAASSRTPTVTDGVGAFRTFCGMSHMAFDDPIVAPGRPGGSHLHTFFGNAGVDAFSDAATIAGSGGSTCRGGTANRSAYWVPSMIDTSTGSAIAPAFLISYYKSGYLGVSPSEIQAFPPGLRMISGRSTATAPDPAPSWRRPVNWNCGFDSTGNGTAFSPGMQQCAPGQFVRLTLAFPQCWNGRDLDSPDHQSHMAWADGTGCPASHPVAVPQVTMNFYWPVPAGGNGAWRLASDMYDGGVAGWSGHADWWNGWDPAVEQIWIDRCVRAGLDCSVEMLGDGRELVGGSF